MFYSARPLYYYNQDQFAKKKKDEFCALHSTSKFGLIDATGISNPKTDIRKGPPPARIGLTYVDCPDLNIDDTDDPKKTLKNQPGRSS